MNIALEQTEEHVNGRVTNRYGDAFIRGNNGEFSHVSAALLLTRLCCKYSISLPQNHCRSSFVCVFASLLIAVSNQCKF